MTRLLWSGKQNQFDLITFKSREHWINSSKRLWQLDRFALCQCLQLFLPFFFYFCLLSYHPSTCASRRATELGFPLMIYWWFDIYLLSSLMSLWHLFRKHVVHKTLDEQQLGKVRWLSISIHRFMQSQKWSIYHKFEKFKWQIKSSKPHSCAKINLRAT